MKFFKCVHEIFSIYDCVEVIYFGKGEDFSTVAIKSSVGHRKLLTPLLKVFTE